MSNVIERAVTAMVSLIALADEYVTDRENADGYAIPTPEIDEAHATLTELRRYGVVEGLAVKGLSYLEMEDGNSWGVFTDRPSPLLSGPAILLVKKEQP